jgi:hypothetical protein
MVELWCVFLSQDRGGDRGSILIPSASYSQDTEFYPLFHIGKEGLATKAVSVIELQS